MLILDRSSALTENLLIRPQAIYVNLNIPTLLANYLGVYYAGFMCDAIVIKFILKLVSLGIINNDNNEYRLTTIAAIPHVLRRKAMSWITIFWITLLAATSQWV